MLKTQKAVNEDKVFWVLKTIESAGFKRFNKEKNRFLKKKVNQELLKLNLKEMLSDLEALKKLPEKSFGKEFAKQLEDNKVDYARFLLQTKNYKDGYEAREVILHDIYHFLFEYNISRNGEFAAVYTQYLQGGFDGLKFISVYGLLIRLLGNPSKFIEGLKLKREVKKRQEGLQVRDYPFEYNLATPLQKVKEEIGIKPMSKFLRSAMRG